MPYLQLHKYIHFYVPIQVTRWNFNSWISSSLFVFSVIKSQLFLYHGIDSKSLFNNLNVVYIYEQVNRRYIINATLEMIDGVKTSHPKNLHACRCTVTIGSYPLTEHIILGILKLFLKTLKHYNFRLCPQFSSFK